MVEVTEEQLRAAIALARKMGRRPAFRVSQEEMGAMPLDRLLAEAGEALRWGDLRSASNIMEAYESRNIYSRMAFEAAHPEWAAEHERLLAAVCKALLGP